MLTKPGDAITSILEQQILQEEVKFREALSIDAEFYILKAIRQTIKGLKAELHQRQAVQHNN